MWRHPDAIYYSCGVTSNPFNGKFQGCLSLRRPGLGLNLFRSPVFAIPPQHSRCAAAVRIDTLRRGMPLQAMSNRLLLYSTMRAYKRRRK